MKRRYIIGGLVTVGVIVLLICGVAYWAYQATQAVPAFYQQALAAPADQQANAGERFEKQLLQLHNETQREGRWQVVLTEAEINGWLAAKLPEKFPHLLSAKMQTPLVSIQRNAMLIGCRYTSSSLATVLTLQLEPYLIDAPNQIAVRLRHARAGTLPVALRQIIDDSNRTAQNAKMLIRWQQVDGDPVAIFELPTSNENKPGFELEGLELKDGQMIITGRTLSKTDTPSRSSD